MTNRRGAPSGDDSVRLYLNDVGGHSLLTKQDEVRLAQAVEAGRRARAERRRPGTG